MEYVIFCGYLPLLCVVFVYFYFILCNKYVMWRGGRYGMYLSMWLYADTRKVYWRYTSMQHHAWHFYMGIKGSNSSPHVSTLSTLINHDTSQLLNTKLLSFIHFALSITLSVSLYTSIFYIMDTSWFFIYIRLPTDGHFGSFHLLAIVAFGYITTMKNNVQDFVLTHFFF